MRKEATLFTANTTILKQESVMDVIQGIAKQPGREEAFYVLDVGDIVKKIKVWRMKMPRVTPFYAVKCNDNKTVLETLALLGTGFDCASKAEMEKVLDLGVDPSRIIYAHPCKPVSHIRRAAKLDVPLMTFDNLAELYKIKNCFPDAKLVIRIRCDAAKAQCNLGIKFGVLPEDAPALLDAAFTLGLEVVGVSFHVGSGCQEPAVFKRAIGSARMVFDYAISLGYTPNLLDIGGGFPGDSDSSLDKLAYYINTSLDQYFPQHCNVKVIAEPGRYVVASAFTLATAVIAHRDTLDNDGKKISSMYYINDGVYGSFNCILYDHQNVTPTLLKKPEEDCEEVSCSIWGPTCDGLDQVVSEMKLPPLQTGDWLVWKNMGAYTLCCANTFNGFPVPSIHVVMHLHTWIYMEEQLGTSVTTADLTENNNKQGGEDSVTVTQMLRTLTVEEDTPQI